MAPVKGLGHVGIYVRDLERMVEFYRDLLGMRITKQNWRAGVVFLSADPASVDHEIALFRGRPDGAEPHSICVSFIGDWWPKVCGSTRW